MGWDRLVWIPGICQCRMGVIDGATVGGCVCSKKNTKMQTKKEGLLTDDENSTVPYSELVYRIISKWVGVNDRCQNRTGALLEKRTTHELQI